MPDITAEMFASLKAQTLDEYERALGGQLLEYHQVVRTGVNDRWGFTSDGGEPSTVMTQLLFAHVYLNTELARKKRLDAAGDSFLTDYDIKLFIPTADLERKGIELSRDDTFYVCPTASSTGSRRSSRCRACTGPASRTVSMAPSASRSSTFPARTSHAVARPAALDDAGLH